MDKALVFFGVGFELVALCIGGIFLGGEIDKYMGWSGGGGTVALILILLIGWFIHLFILLRRFDQDVDPNSKS
ncbi:MAG: hypothetical protein AB7G93_02130 [Bdellovibrionales bacterium]